MDGEATDTAPEADRSAELRRFLLGVLSWFGSFGLHNVLFSTLLVVELQEDEIRVGIAQSAIMIPAVILMLLGGAVADRAARRPLLIGLHFGASALAVALAAALAAGQLSYGLLLVYAVAMGTLQAFINPARDALLSEVAPGDIGRPVALMNLTQWGSQAAGALLGASSRIVGIAPLFVVQACVLLAGALGFGALRTRPALRAPGAAAPPSLSFRELTSGIREVASQPQLLTTWILVCAVGVLFIGPFMVVFPLMVRDVYGGGAPEIALVSTAFPLGTITGSIAVVRLGGVGDKLIAQTRALLSAALTLIVISMGLPFWGCLAGVFVWGLAGSVFMIAGRTLFQESASIEHRGRVLATYSMGFMGAAGLFGAPLSGYLAGQLGPEGALGALGATMIAVVAIAGLTVRRARSRADSSPGA